MAGSAVVLLECGPAAPLGEGGVGGTPFGSRPFHRRDCSWGAWLAGAALATNAISSRDGYLDSDSVPTEMCTFACVLPRAKLFFFTRLCTSLDVTDQMSSFEPPRPSCV